MAFRRSKRQSDERPGGVGHCPHCGAAVEPGARFCSECGSSMNMGAAAAPTPARQGSQWQLAVVDGPDAGRKYKLGARTHVGRGSESEVQLADPQASRLHALVQRLGDDYVLSDEGSRNGTFLRGTRLEGPARLRDGDLIKIGNTLLKVVAPAPPAYAPPPAPPAYAPPPAPPAYAPAPIPPGRASGEGVVGVVAMLERRKGLLGSESYTLVMTLERLIFAKMTSNMLKEIIAQARQEAKDQGKGFFGQWGAQLGAYAAHAQRYVRMPVEEILREHPDNFQIPVAQVRKVRIKAGYRDDERVEPDRLEIHAADKMRFNLKGTSAGEARKVLRQVLGDRVK